MPTTLIRETSSCSSILHCGSRLGQVIDDREMTFLARSGKIGWAHYLSMTMIKTLLSVTLLAATSAQVFDGCSIDSYYADFNGNPSGASQEALSNLLKSTHRNVLPIRNDGADDVYQALIDLYPGDEDNTTVFLVYRNISYPARPYANTNKWQRGNIWPDSKFAPLLIDDSPADTDIFVNYPVDVTVYASKQDFFFGLCGTVQEPEYCKALPEAADTFTDRKIWQPPPFMRGDQARSLFYMVTRYMNIEISTGQNVSLTLGDCPPFGPQEYGFLSVLLQWHMEDPVDDWERERNNRACERWQGNRNPFVDFPELVDEIFGSPDTIKEGFRAYSQCFDSSNLVQTDAPTATPNLCADVNPGDIEIILMNTEEPDQIAFFTLDNIRHGVGTIYITDRPWDGTSFRENGEGTMKWEIPPETNGLKGELYNGLAPGYLFSYGFDKDVGQWETEGEGTFDLDPMGDSLLVYCIDADDKPHFINAFTYSEGGFAQAGSETYGEDTTSLPSDFESVGYVAVPTFKNYIYVGTTNDRKSALLQDYAQAENYQGSEIRSTIQILDSTSSSKMTSLLVATLVAVASVVVLV